MRALGLAIALVALGVYASPALAADSISVDAPAQTTFGDSIPVHVSGNSDVANAIVGHFVQKEDCPSTRDQAVQQPDSPEQNLQGFPNPGPFAYDTTLSSGPNGPALDGIVHVCVYLYSENPDGTSTTLAMAIDAVDIRRPEVATFGITIAAHPRMAAGKTIPITFKCPNGCSASISWKGLGPAKSLSHRLGRGSTVIHLPLDAKTVARVKQLRHKHSSRGVPLKITASAAQKSPKRTAHLNRTVAVR